MDWKTNPAAVIKFVRDHHRPSFMEYGEYPYVSADEVKKALKLKAAFSSHARPDAVRLQGPTCSKATTSSTFLLTRAPALGARYEFLSFRNAAGGRAWLSAISEHDSVRLRR